MDGTEWGWSPQSPRTTLLTCLSVQHFSSETESVPVPSKVGEREGGHKCLPSEVSPQCYWGRWNSSTGKVSGILHGQRSSWFDPDNHLRRH